MADDIAIAVRKIFIGGLSYGTDDEKLRKYFSTFGTVQDAIVMKDPVSRRSRGFGFVTYKDVASVDNALANDPHTIDSRKVEAKRSVPRMDGSWEAGAGANSANSGGKGASKESSGGPGSTERSNSQPHNPQVDRDPNNNPPQRKSDYAGGGSNNQPTDPRINMEEYAYKKIFVGGLHYDTRDAEFKAYFEKFGKIISGEVMFNRETHKSRGFGFIVFELEKGADAVCAIPEHTINGKEVEVKKAIPRSKIAPGTSAATIAQSLSSGNSSSIAPQNNPRAGHSRSGSHGGDSRDSRGQQSSRSQAPVSSVERDRESSSAHSEQNQKKAPINYAAAAGSGRATTNTGAGTAGSSGDTGGGASGKDSSAQASNPSSQEANPTNPTGVPKKQFESTVLRIGQAARKPASESRQGGSGRDGRDDAKGRRRKEEERRGSGQGQRDSRGNANGPNLDQLSAQMSQNQKEKEVPPQPPASYAAALKLKLQAGLGEAMPPFASQLQPSALSGERSPLGGRDLDDSFITVPRPRAVSGGNKYLAALTGELDRTNSSPDRDEYGRNLAFGSDINLNARTSPGSLDRVLGHEANADLLTDEEHRRGGRSQSILSYTSDTGTVGTIGTIGSEHPSMGSSAIGSFGDLNSLNALAGNSSVGGGWGSDAGSLVSAGLGGIAAGGGGGGGSFSGLSWLQGGSNGPMPVDTETSSIISGRSVHSHSRNGSMGGSTSGVDVETLDSQREDAFSDSASQRSDVPRSNSIMSDSQSLQSDGSQIGSNSNTGSQSMGQGQGPASSHQRAQQEWQWQQQQQWQLQQQQYQQHHFGNVGPNSGPSGNGGGFYSAHGQGGYNNQNHYQNQYPNNNNSLHYGNAPPNSQHGSGGYGQQGQGFSNNNNRDGPGMGNNGNSNNNSWGNNNPDDGGGYSPNGYRQAQGGQNVGGGSYGNSNGNGPWNQQNQQQVGGPYNQDNQDSGGNMDSERDDSNGNGFGSLGFPELRLDSLEWSPTNQNQTHSNQSRSGSGPPEPESKSK